MKLWDWMSDPYYEYRRERFGTLKRVLAGLAVFVAMPILIYAIVTWDPVIAVDEDGEPVQVGIYIIFGLYWIGAYFSIKQHETRKQLNLLLDKLLNDEEADRIFEIAKRRRKALKDNEFLTEKGEKRLRWFGIS